MARFVEINGHQVNAEVIASVHAEPTPYMGWKYDVWLTTTGGHRIRIDSVGWNREGWGDYEPANGARTELGLHAVKERVRHVANVLSVTSPYA